MPQPQSVHFHSPRYNDLPVSNPRYYVQRDGGLLIRYAQDMDDGREFSCHIFSPGGNLTCKTTINIVQLPLQPSSPRASEIQAYSMRLTWDAPSDGGSAITGESHSFSFYLMQLLSQKSVDLGTFCVIRLKLL